MRMTEEEKFGISLLTNAIGLRHDPIAPLFEMSVGRIFLKHVRSLPPYAGRRRFEAIQWHWVTLAQEYLEANADAITHVADWLSTSHFECSPWLLRQDDQHRPLKLMKCGTLERLVHEADKAENRLHQRHPHFLALSSKDESWELDLGAGYSLVRLLTTNALDFEGARMRHCIGHGSYDKDLHEGEEFYSIRDPDNRPRATLQIVPRVVDGQTLGRVRQCQGPRNTTPHAHVLDLVAGAMSDMGWTYGPATKSEIAADGHDLTNDDDIAAAFVVGFNLR